jgi:hypothetical protein
MESFNNPPMHHAGKMHGVKNNMESFKNIMPYNNMESFRNIMPYNNMAS